MSDLCRLSEAQMRRIEPYFPLSHGVPRVGDRRIVSGIIFVIRNSTRCPNAKTFLGDRGYDADWFRAALADRGIAACIPSKANRKAPIPHDTTLYRRRHKIENMLADSETGAASTPAMIAAPILHVRHLAGRRRHLLDLINESRS